MSSTELRANTVTERLVMSLFTPKICFHYSLPQLHKLTNMLKTWLLTDRKSQKHTTYRVVVLSAAKSWECWMMCISKESVDGVAQVLLCVLSHEGQQKPYLSFIPPLSQSFSNLPSLFLHTLFLHTLFLLLFLSRPLFSCFYQQTFFFIKTPKLFFLLVLFFFLMFDLVWFGIFSRL